MNQRNNLYVELHIPDFELAKEFYGELGFEVEWEKEPNDADGYLVMDYQDNILCFYGGEEEVHNHSYF